MTDGQHSVRALSNSSAVTTDSYDYNAFGTSYQNNGLTLNPYRFTGQQYDSTTGLYSLRARYYDPTDGRFLSRDTWPLNMVNPAQLNRYGYAINHPINYYDPNGNDALAGYGLNTEQSMKNGMIAGGFGGFAFSTFFYTLAWFGECGSLAREWAEETNGAIFVIQSTLEGMLVGAMAGAVISSGPVGQAIVGAGGYVAGFNMVWQSSKLEGACQDFVRTAGLFTMGTSTLTIHFATGGNLPKWPGSGSPKFSLATAGSGGRSGSGFPWIGTPGGNGGPGGISIGGIGMHTGTIPTYGTITGIAGATAARDATATMSDAGGDEEIKGYYEDGTPAYEKDVEPRLGNPGPDDYQSGRHDVRMDRGNNRIYQERIYTQTTDGQRIVIDIDYTNHRRPDHVPRHHHFYVENVRGNVRSGWKKVGNIPGFPNFDGEGNFVGSLP